MLDRLAQRDAANNVLLGALVSKVAGRLRMAESYEGEVVSSSDECVVVVFELHGELVEQTYDRKQFVDGRLPGRGYRVAAYVHIVEFPAEEETQPDGLTTSDGTERPRKRRKNVVRLPRTF